MKKTMIIKFLFSLGIALFLGSAAFAQTSQASSVKANLLEVQANLDDLMSKDQNNPDIPLLIEKRDYLQQLFDELTNVQGGTEGQETGRSVSGKGGQQATSNQTLNAAAATSSSADILAQTEKELEKLRALNSDDPAIQAKIKAYESRLDALKKKQGN